MELLKFEIAQAEIDYRRERAERGSMRRNLAGMAAQLRADRRRANRPVAGHHH